MPSQTFIPGVQVKDNSITRADLDITDVNSLYPSLSQSRTKHAVLIGPIWSDGPATFRVLDSSDVPTVAITSVTGSLLGTASWANNSKTASVANSAFISSTTAGGANYLTFITAALNMPGYTDLRTTPTIQVQPDLGSITATTFNGALNGNALTATSASYAKTSSYAINGGGNVTTIYTTIVTSSTQWITCSFLDVQEFVNITIGQLYHFTCSNTPTSNNLAEVSLFINNTATATSSLSFPDNWKFLGSKPNAISSSKSGILSLRSYGSSVQVAGFSIQY